jgi:hypothetical protein
MYGADGRCKICDTPAYAEAVDAHAEKHLADGSAVLQGDSEPLRWRVCLMSTMRWPAKDGPPPRVMPTASAPSVDADGIGLYENDGDKFDRTDANSENLRAAYAKVHELNRQTKARIRAAQREAQ